MIKPVTEDGALMGTLGYLRGEVPLGTGLGQLPAFGTSYLALLKWLNDHSDKRDPEQVLDDDDAQVGHLIANEPSP